MRSGYRSIAEGIILTIVTCGIYNLFWNWYQMQTCNELVGREEFSPVKVYLLSIVTCGLYFVYYQYCMGGVIVEIQRKRAVTPFENLPIMSLFLSLFGLSIIVDAVHQNEINKFFPKPV
ncbi:MAG: DUF4234 domain-containing protein [Elusimicrobiota bacterium]|nr:DUF4234 domain-containing protein [Elusimicrobiota bacterium]